MRSGRIEAYSHEKAMIIIDTIDHRVRLRLTQGRKKDEKARSSISWWRFPLLTQSDFKAGYGTPSGRIEAYSHEMAMIILDTIDHRVHLHIRSPLYAKERKKSASVFC